jgi:hypothetical protein
MGQLSRTLDPLGWTIPVLPGTNVIILKIFSPKNIGIFFAQTAASFLQKVDHNIGF